MRSKLFSADDLKKIESAVHDAESRSAGEIVTLVLPASSDYWLVSIAAGLFGALTAAGIGMICHLTHPGWGLSFQLGLGLPLLGFSIGLLAARLPALLRMITPKGMMAQHTHREAMAHFMALGVANTRDRTGVLLVISEAEHRVELLADAGIHAKVPEGHWKSLVDELIQAIRQRRPADGVATLLKKVADDLATHFPRRDDDTNELNNRVLIGKQY